MTDYNSKVLINELIIDKNNDKRGKTGTAPTRTITMTFRINESLMKKLKNEAEDREISLNTLVNQIFRRYVEWYSFEPKVGMIPIAKPVVINFLKILAKIK